MIASRDGSATPAAAAAAAAAGRPGTLDELTGWVEANIDPNQYVESKLRGWAGPYGVSWTFDALMLAKDAAPRAVARYVNRTLLAWHAEGGPPHDRAAAPRPSKAAARSEAIRMTKAGLRAHFDRKEARDGEGE